MQGKKRTLKQKCEIMNTKSKAQTTVAARITGEDIQPGDYVTVLNEIVELPSFLWSCSGTTLPMDEPVRIRCIPREAGLPCKVVAVCLPFVYAKRPHGKLAMFDTRQQQLVRLDPARGCKVWKEMKAVMKSRTE
jgi:hypothetical protein